MGGMGMGGMGMNMGGTGMNMGFSEGSINNQQSLENFMLQQ